MVRFNYKGHVVLAHPWKFPVHNCYAAKAIIESVGPSGVTAEEFIVNREFPTAEMATGAAIEAARAAIDSRHIENSF